MNLMEYQHSIGPYKKYKKLLKGTLMKSGRGQQDAIAALNVPDQKMKEHQQNCVVFLLTPHQCAHIVIFPCKQYASHILLTSF